MVAHVRPWIRVTARIVLPMLIAVAGWTVWDNLETRRLNDAYASLTARNTQSDIDAAPPRTADSDDAGRYYAAAAVMALDSAPSGGSTAAQVLMRQREALTGGGPLSVEERDARDAWLARSTMLNALVERAAWMRYRAFPAGAQVQARLSGLTNAARAQEMTTLGRLAHGDGTSAAVSLAAHVRLLRAFEFDWFGAAQKSANIVDAATDLGILLSVADAAELEAVARAFADAYADTETAAVALGFARSRYEFAQALASGRTWQSGAGAVSLRPIIKHAAVGVMHTAAQALEAARRPWPRRLDAMAGVPGSLDRQPRQGLSLSFGYTRWLGTHDLPRATTAIASGVAAARAASVAIAIEAFRRRTGTLPHALADLRLDSASLTDPFSGEPLRYGRDGAGFVVFSVGSNRRDEGGQIEPATPITSAPGTGPRPDIGIRVTYRTASRPGGG